MKKPILFSALLLSFASLPHVRADGHGPGNGGTVYICDGGKKAYLVDLLEPMIRTGMRDYFRVEESNAPVEEQVRKAFATLNEILPFSYRDLTGHALREWEQFRKNLSWRNGKYEWTVTSDVGNIPIPEGCEVKNAIMYISDEEIDGQNQYRELLSPTHQAALEVHEVLYKMMRSEGIEKESAIPARRLTALLFSNLKARKDLARSLVAKYLAYGIAGPMISLSVPKEAVTSGKPLYLADYASLRSKRCTSGHWWNETRHPGEVSSDDAFRALPDPSILYGSSIDVLCEGKGDFAFSVYQYNGKVDGEDNRRKSDFESRAMTPWIGTKTYLDGEGKRSARLILVSPELDRYMIGNLN